MKKVKLLVAMIVLCACVLVMLKQCNAEDGLSPLNIQGDTLFLPKSNELTAGVGYQVATVLNGLVEIRAEYAASFKTTTEYKFGAGIGINFMKMIEMVNGKWTLTSINPTIGIIALYDFKGGAVEPGIYLSIVKVVF